METMIYFNEDTMRFFGTDPEFYLSVGELLSRYKQNFEGGSIFRKIRKFEEDHEREIDTIDSDHAARYFSVEEISEILSVLKIGYTRIYG